MNKSFITFLILIVFSLSVKSQSVTIGSATDMTVCTSFQINVITANMPLTKGAQFSITYDPAILQCDALTTPNPGGLVNAANPSPGVITYAFASFTAVPFNLTIITIDFTCIGYGNSNLAFSSIPTLIKFSGASAQYYPTLNNGLVSTVSEPTLATYNGTGNWNDCANWDPRYPSANTDVMIDGNVTVTNNGVCKNMTIKPNRTLTVNTGFTLTVGGNVLIESTAAGIGSLIDLGTLTVTGTATVQQYIRDSYYDGHWHLISIPVDEVHSYATFLNFYLKRYLENLGEFKDVQADPGPGGDEILNVPMEGFSTSNSGWHPDTTIAFVGNLNTGNKSKGFTYTSGEGDGWNLLGNPYPSSIDWNEVVIPAGLNPTVYLYDGTAKNYVYYIEGGPSTALNSFVPPAQGFFVQATAAGTLALDNTVRAHGTQNFYKQSRDFSNCLKLQTSGNNYTDISFIMFDGNSTTGFDRDYDVAKLMGNEIVPSLYSFIDNNAYALNVLPSVNDTPKVELAFQTAQNGTYTIAATGIESFETGTPLLLEDLVTNQVIDLRQNPVHTFAYNTSDPLHRFNVHFKNTFGIGEISNGSVNIFGGDNEINVMFAKQFSGNITVTDIMGRTIYSGAVNGLENVIPVTGSSQYYIVKVSGSSKVITEKVFVR